MTQLGEAELARRFDVATAVAREAGQLALGHFRNRTALEIESKGHQDWVSRADREVEVLIRRRLMEAFPGDAFLGEEDGLTGAPGGDGGTWAVDPIDGTSCFLTGIPTWCVSIAFAVGGEVEIGVINAPVTDELFSARRGGAAHLNGAPMQASPASSLEHGSVGVGISNRVTPDAVLAFIDSLVRGGGLYFRNGSGALMLAYVAAGRLLGYYEPHMNAWDCLGGVALVRAAGGTTNDVLAGDGLMSGSPVLAGGKGVFAALTELAESVGTRLQP